jgi:hypothetical protein
MHLNGYAPPSWDVRIRIFITFFLAFCDCPTGDVVFISFTIAVLRPTWVFYEFCISEVGDSALMSVHAVPPICRSRDVRIIRMRLFCAGGIEKTEDDKQLHDAK